MGKFVKDFIDDFCVFSSREDHCKKLELALQRYDKCKGQLNLEKCHLVQPRVKAFGKYHF